MTTLRLAHRGDWRVAPENSLAAIEAALRTPDCDGLEFDIRVSADGVPGPAPRREPRPGPEACPPACVTLTAAQLAVHGIPTLGQVLARHRLRVLPRRRAEGARPGGDRRPRARARGAPARTAARRFETPCSPRSSPRSSNGSPSERPAWPRWLNAYDLSPRDDRCRDRARLLGDLRRVACRSTQPASPERRDAGLEVASWTVRELGRLSPAGGASASPRSAWRPPRSTAEVGDRPPRSARPGDADRDHGHRSDDHDGTEPLERLQALADRASRRPARTPGSR